MNTIILFLFICAGITIIIVDSKIFENLRTWLEKISPNFFGYLINCYLCCGFWVGVFVNFILNPLSLFYFDNLYINIFFYPIFTIFAGALSSLISYAIGKILSVLSELEAHLQVKTEETRLKVLDNIEEIEKEEKN